MLETSKHTPSPLSTTLPLTYSLASTWSQSTSLLQSQSHSMMLLMLVQKNSQTHHSTYTSRSVPQLSPLQSDSTHLSVFTSHDILISNLLQQSQSAPITLIFRIPIYMSYLSECKLSILILTYSNRIHVLDSDKEVLHPRVDSHTAAIK